MECARCHVGIFRTPVDYWTNFYLARFTEDFVYDHCNHCLGGFERGEYPVPAGARLQPPARVPPPPPPPPHIAAREAIIAEEEEEARMRTISYAHEQLERDEIARQWAAVQRSVRPSSEGSANRCMICQSNTANLTCQEFSIIQAVKVILKLSPFYVCATCKEIAEAQTLSNGERKFRNWSPYTPPP